LSKSPIISKSILPHFGIITFKLSKIILYILPLKPSGSDVKYSLVDINEPFTINLMFLTRPSSLFEVTLSNVNLAIAKRKSSTLFAVIFPLYKVLLINDHVFRLIY
jgi:hypothetical protein